MPHSLVKDLLAQLGRTTPGKHVVQVLLERDTGAERFPSVASWPERIEGFEDLDFLFTSSQLDHGIASLRFDEAAFLYRLVKSLGPAGIAEIGRFKGGSTFLIASAMARGSELWSYDLHVALREDLPGSALDEELADALARYGLAGDVHLVVGDSRAVDPPARPLDLVFVDGDHTYEGACADAERWREFLRPGGHLLFHDAVDTGGYGNVYPGVAQAVAEIEDQTLARVDGVGSIAHFVRLGKSTQGESDR